MNKRQTYRKLTIDVKSAEIYNEYNTQSIQVDPPAKKHDSED
jgi:hypothetical protein